MSEASTRTIGSTLAAKASAKKTPGTGANADVPVKGKMSREEFMREKALDEARKAGSIPAELDEEGNEINPHIPTYISKAPWYLDIGRPTLSHQRGDIGHKPRERSLHEKEWYRRGVKADQAATKYRKGACENCGALSHKTKECMERPRKLGAKWTNSDIKPDEFVQEIDLDYDGKRDRWNGYDPSAHQKVIDQFQEVEEVRRKLREKELEEKMRKKAEQAEQGDDKELDIADLSSDDDDDEGDLEHLDNELKYAEQADMPGQKIDKKSRTTVRNLRLREDTAKYLRNLDVESAYYDPKTRSMRQNPNPDKAPEELQFAGDNFVRWSGDATQMAKMQVFAWQAYEKGVDVNLQADPTRAALLHKEYAKKADAVKDTARDSIIAKYGGEEHLKNAPPKELLLGQTEEYVEYSAAGKLVKGVEKAKARSKYDEDNYTKFGSGHTSVYGSFYDVDAKRWGYQCCRSTFRGSYCTGAAGIQAAADVPTSADNVARMEEVQLSQPASKTLKEMHLERLLGEGEAREAKRQRQ